MEVDSNYDEREYEFDTGASYDDSINPDLYCESNGDWITGR